MACPVYPYQIDAQQLTLVTPDSGFHDAVPIPPGATGFTVHVDRINTGDGTQITFAYWQFDDTGAIIHADSRILHESDTLPEPLPAVLVYAGATQVMFRVQSSVSSMFQTIGSSGSIEFAGPCTPTNFCTYGTQAREPNLSLVQVSPAVIIEIAEQLGYKLAPWTAILAGLTVVATNTLCSTNPPLCVYVYDTDWTTLNQYGVPVAWGKLKECFIAALWDILCKCQDGPPGSPPPISPPSPITPPPSPLPPPSLPPPTRPPLCDEGDICSSLATINQTLTGLATLIGNMSASLANQVSGLQAIDQATSDLVVLIQRQHVPFAYLHGTTHAGLTGAGTITVSGILGLSVDCSVIPAWLSATMAPVNSYFKLGEIAWGTADGYLARRIVTHDPHLFLDIPGDVTRVAYLFVPGVTASITELRREP